MITRALWRDLKTLADEEDYIRVGISLLAMLVLFPLDIVLTPIFGVLWLVGRIVAMVVPHD